MKRFAIIGSNEETARVKDILEQSTSNIDHIEFVSSSDEQGNWAAGTMNQLDQLVHIHKLNEIVFCAKDTSAHDIISWMSKIDSKHIDFKIAQPDSLYLIGSNSIDTAGDLYVVNINAISKKENIRNKRTFDVIVGILLFISSPVTVWVYKNKKQFLRNILQVIFGKKSIVGYVSTSSENKDTLPKLRPGILHPDDILKSNDSSIQDKINLIYARDYKIQKDISILLSSWKNLDYGNIN